MTVGVTREEAMAAVKTAAAFVREHGERFLPLFERCEEIAAEFQQKNSAFERAMAMKE